MNCLLCNEPFGENPITLNCGHTFDKTCLRQDFLNKQENLELCTCPICLKPYNSSLLINVYIPKTKEQRNRIFEIQDWVKKTARTLDTLYEREHAPNEYTANPTKDSMNEARLMGKQFIKKKAQQKEKEQKELIFQQQELIKQLQKENEVLVQQQIEIKVLVREQKELIQELQKENEVLVQQQIEIKVLVRELQAQKPKSKPKKSELVF